MIFLEKINDIGVVEYLCNIEEDLQNITIQDIKPGSMAHVITPKKDYILDEDKTWVEYIKNGEKKKKGEYWLEVECEIADAHKNIFKDGIYYETWDNPYVYPGFFVYNEGYSTLNLFSACKKIKIKGKLGYTAANLFYDCWSLEELDLSELDTSNVKDMYRMFYGCALTSLDLSNFNTSNVTNMERMFGDCRSLTSLDLSGFNTSNVRDITNMFDYCLSLNTIYVSNNWDVSNVTYSNNMFYYCELLVGGSGTTYDSNYIDKTYAHIDDGPSNPGYLTLKSN